MIRDAFQWLADQAHAKEVEGTPYFTKALHLPPEPVAEPIGVVSLSAVFDYCEANRDQLALEDCVLHVASPHRVSLLGDLSELNRKREEYIRATCEPLQKVDTWLSREHFQIWLTTNFVSAGDCDELLSLVARVDAGSSTRLEDDGVTQKVTVKAGVSRLANENPKPVVELFPFRTFREVVQPSSEFLFRVRDDGDSIRCALFEADGGAWQLQAIERIANHLRARARAGMPTVLA